MNEEKILNRAECSALRGLAIAGIVLHNYCHWLGFAVKENEYQYFTANNAGLQHALAHPDGQLFIHLLSYFGHYGVPIFLFLSGFGLVMKYENGRKPVGCWRCARYNYLKLLRMMFVGFVAFLFVDAITPGRFPFHWDNVVAQLLMYINVLPHPDNIIWPGPYWFFGLMMQLYLVYRLLLYRRRTEYVVLLILGCWLLQVFCDPFGETLNRLRYNCIGGMLPFGAGIIIGRLGQLKPVTHHSRRFWAVLLVAAAALTLLMCFSYQSWFWVPVMVITTAVAIVKLLPASWLNALVWLGGLSAALFVSHPIARKVFIPLSRRGDPYDGLMLYVIAAIAIAWLTKLVIDRIPKPKLDPEQ